MTWMLQDFKIGDIVYTGPKTTRQSIEIIDIGSHVLVGRIKETNEIKIMSVTQWRSLRPFLHREREEIKAPNRNYLEYVASGLIIKPEDCEYYDSNGHVISFDSIRVELSDC